MKCHPISGSQDIVLMHMNKQLCRKPFHPPSPECTLSPVYCTVVQLSTASSTRLAEPDPSTYPPITSTPFRVEEARMVWYCETNPLCIQTPHLSYHPSPTHLHLHTFTFTYTPSPHLHTFTSPTHLHLHLHTFTFTYTPSPSPTHLHLTYIRTSHSASPSTLCVPSLSQIPGWRTGS